MGFESPSVEVTGIWGRNSSLVVFGLAVLRNAASQVRSSSGEIFQ